MKKINKNTALFFVCKQTHGGAERRFFHLYETARQEYDNIFLITNSELLNSLTPSKKDSNIFHKKIAGHKKITLIKYIINSIFFIKSKHIKHIHFCVNPSPYSMVYSLFSLIFSFSTSVSIVNSTYRSKNDYSLAKKIQWLLTLRNVSWIDYLSPSISKNMANIFKTRVTSKNSSISVCSFSSVAEKNFTADLKYDEDVKTYDILFASRLIINKGVDILLQSLEYIDTNNKKKLSVCILGSGAFFDEIKKKRMNSKI